MSQVSSFKVGDSYTSDLIRLSLDGRASAELRLKDSATQVKTDD
jgi:hypothetical protein